MGHPKDSYGGKIHIASNVGGFLISIWIDALATDTCYKERRQVRLRVAKMPSPPMPNRAVSRDSSMRLRIRVNPGNSQRMRMRIPHFPGVSPAGALDALARPLSIGGRQGNTSTRERQKIKSPRNPTTPSPQIDGFETGARPGAYRSWHTRVDI